KSMNRTAFLSLTKIDKIFSSMPFTHNLKEVPFCTGASCMRFHILKSFHKDDGSDCTSSFSHLH
ncbi:MAG: hypothetical protein Q4F72_09570, partial [Desulfovibrionaceae bacterium]|nr:hypothetical protein [Desulfovibrionaceae bacterium]